LIRGRRRLVLFLRRFGYDEATEALSFAAASTMGQRWRLVTLDDTTVTRWPSWLRYAPNIPR
ncbi:MAG: hypothetical protein AB2785_13535, partial [Candidatus Thiodiazotropha endolucinida]